MSTTAPKAPAKAARTVKRETAWTVPPTTGRSAGLKLTLDGDTILAKIGNQAVEVDRVLFGAAAGEITREASVTTAFAQAAKARETAERSIEGAR